MSRSTRAANPANMAECSWSTRVRPPLLGSRHPPGLHTRRISESARSGRPYTQSEKVSMTLSKLASANRIACGPDNGARACASQPGAGLLGGGEERRGEERRGEERRGEERRGEDQEAARLPPHP